MGKSGHGEGIYGKVGRGQGHTTKQADRKKENKKDGRALTTRERQKKRKPTLGRAGGWGL